MSSDASAGDAPVPTRPRGRPRMPRERIVRAALELVDEQGAAQLSFRSLANRLGSSTATLYRHFDDRAELVQAVVDLVLSEADLPVAMDVTTPWWQALSKSAHHLFDALERHREAAPLLAEHVPTGPQAMAFREACLATLLDAGFAPRFAAESAATLGRLVLGFAMQLLPELVESTDDLEVARQLSGIDPDRYPAITATAVHMPVPLRQEFDLALRLLLTGLHELGPDA